MSYKDRDCKIDADPTVLTKFIVYLGIGIIASRLVPNLYVHVETALGLL